MCEKQAVGHIGSQALSVCTLKCHVLLDLAYIMYFLTGLCHFLNLCVPCMYRGRFEYLYSSVFYIPDFRLMKNTLELGNNFNCKILKQQLEREGNESSGCNHCAINQLL